MLTAIFATNSARPSNIQPPAAAVLASAEELAWAEPAGSCSWSNGAPMCLEDRLCEIFARILTQMQDDLLKHAKETEALRLEYAKNPDGLSHEQSEILLERQRLEKRGWDIRSETLSMYLGMADALNETAERVIQSIAK